MRINYKKLALLLLPTFLRSRVLSSWLKVFMTPIQTIHDIHHEEHRECIYSLQCTGQVCRMKDALNRYFGVGNYKSGSNYNQGFKIKDVSAKGDWMIIYNEVETFDDNQVLLQDNEDSLLLCSEAEILLKTVSFDVMAPSELEIGERLPEVRAIVEQYRLASRKARYAHINEE